MPRPSAFCQRPPSQYVGLVARLPEVDVLDGAHALRSRTQAGRGRVLPGRTAACGHGGASRRGRSRRPGRARREICAVISRAICSTGRRLASARSRTRPRREEAPVSSTSPGISSAGTAVARRPRRRTSDERRRRGPDALCANSMASAVAGMAGMIEALVSAPCSKHSIVARTVSADAPKSSACRTIRMRLASSASCRARGRTGSRQACIPPTSTRGGTRSSGGLRPPRASRGTPPCRSWRPRAS